MFLKNPTTFTMFSRSTHALKAKSRMVLPLQHFATVTSPPNPPKGSQGPTGVLLMNLGGPSNLNEVQPFLHRLFSDPELIPIPFQKYLAPWIASRRTPQIQDQYAQIGGGSPIRMWTEKQADEMVKLLDKLSPQTAPHKPYIAFRYAPPLCEDTIKQIQEDGVKRVIAFTQYPQYSCSTTGSSVNELVNHIKANNLENKINFSVIDRWHSHPGLVDAFVDRIESKLDEYDSSVRDQVPILFSAHSLPMTVVNRGDAYPSEVASTVTRVMEKLNRKNPYSLVWQSQVGPQPWLGPQTSDALKGLAEQGKKNALLVPIAFTSDHIETLFELDLEYGEEAKELGITGLKRAESLNDSPVFIKALADLVHSHIQNNFAPSTQLSMRCPGCKRESCKSSRDFFIEQYEKSLSEPNPAFSLNNQTINHQKDSSSKASTEQA